MGIFTFRGGIHPYDGKELTKDKKIKEYNPKGELCYPLNQHLGAPAVPIVGKGDRVLVGEKIAEACGFISANIHSSVSGTVIGIESRLTASGEKVNSILIENDFTYEEAAYQKGKAVELMTKEEIRDRVKEAGVVGMGGAGFPTNVKLTPKNQELIDFVIVNCAECEPYLTSDYRKMLEDPEQIVGGLKVILRLFDKAQGIFAIEDNKPEAIKRMTEIIKDDNRLRVIPLKTKYPQGAERQLIYGTTGRCINSSMLPADVGCIVNNVDSVISVYQAVLYGKPLIQKVITVTGDALWEPCNLLVRVGTNVQELIQAAGGYKSKPEKVIVGGPMMGVAQFSLNVPVVKTTSALLCYTKDEVKAYEPSNCIKCGRCVQVCPGGVIPSKLATFSDHGNEEGFLTYDGMECCDCGCCSFICPAKRHLTQSIKTMRRDILRKRKK